MFSKTGWKITTSSHASHIKNNKPLDASHITYSTKIQTASGQNLSLSNM